MDLSQDGQTRTAIDSPSPGEKKSRRGRKPSGKLSRKKIVATALTIARRDGGSSVTMRRIATEAGVGTMSLYRYIDDRDDLLSEMLGVALKRVKLRRLKDPIDELLSIFDGLYSLFRSEPWVITVMVNYAGGNAHVLAINERVVVALKKLGMSDDVAFHTLHTLMHYTYGEAMLMEAWDRRMQSRDPSPVHWDHEQYPTISRMVEKDMASEPPEVEPYISNVRRVLLWASNSTQPAV
ncbi:MAG: TetR/AcrR family transcriptional regulator [Pseudomonadota bacterium]